MTNIRLSEYCDSESVALPQSLADKLGIRPGDKVILLETENGIEIRRGLDSVETQMEIANEIMAEDEPVLRKLAE